MPQKGPTRERAGAGRVKSPGYLSSWLRLFGVGLVCFKLTVVPVIFDQPADLPFTVVKGLISHASAYVLAAVIVALALKYRASFLVWSWLHIPVVAFLAANTLAALFAADRLLALYGTHDRMVGLSTIADGVVLYFAVVLLVRTRSEAIALVASGLGGLAVVLAYEALQLLGKDPFTWSVDSSLRPFSTFGQTTNLAEYLTVAAVGAAAFALFGIGANLFARIGLALASGLAVAGLIATQTRSALVGLIAGGVVLVLLTWTKHPNRTARIATLATALVGSAAVATGLLLTPLGTRILGTVEVAAAAEGDAGPRLERSADVRVALYRIGFDMLRDRPLLGYGPDNFLAGLPTYRSENEPVEVQQSPVSSAHGWLAQIAATSGIVGLVTFLSIALVAATLTVRAGFKPVVWAALAMLAAFLAAGATTVNSVATDWLFWASTGGVAAAFVRQATPVATPLARRPPSRRRRRVPVSFAGLACAAVALLAALTALNAVDASRAARASQVARLQGRTQEAIQLGLRATRQDPQRPQYWDTLGLAYVSSDRFKDAASSFAQAMALAPYDVRYHGDLARAYVVLAQRGDTQSGSRARDIGARAIAMDPNNPEAQLTRAIAMQITGDLPEALKSVERALALNKGANRDLYVTATQILVATGQFDRAVTVGRQGMTLLAPVDIVPIRIEVARALLAGGHASEAFAEVEAALAVRPNDAAALRLRAQIRAELGLQ